MTRARQAAEALFTPKRQITEQLVFGLPTGQPIGVRTARAGNLIDLTGQKTALPSAR